MGSTAVVTSPPLLEFHALGTLFVRLDGVELKLPMNAQRLLIYLAIKGPTIERSTLAGVLYSESTEVRALGNLRTLVSRTRQLVPDHLRSDRNDVRLDGATWVDANTVDTGDLLALRFRWRGAFLEGHGNGDTLYDEWVRRKRVRIEERFTSRLHTAVVEAEERQDWTRCRELAHFINDFDPWSETGFRALLRATHETSGQASALALYERFRDRLASEVGIGPSAETERLASELLGVELAAGRVAADAEAPRSTSTRTIGPDSAGAPPGRASEPPAPPARSISEQHSDHPLVPIHESLHARVAAHAQAEGASVDEIVTAALSRFLNER